MIKKERKKNDFYIALGTAIKAKRIIKGMTLDALGKKAGGMTRATVSGIEKGRQKVGVHQLVLFAKALETNLDSLIYDAMGAQDIEESVQIVPSNSQPVILSDL